MKTLFASICICFSLFTVQAEISFLSPDINNRNEVLFSVRTDLSGIEPYNTLFLHSINTGKTEQLTFYPETMESLSGGSILQIRNRFGSLRYNVSAGTFGWIQEFKPFYAGGTIGYGIMEDVSSSPDGNWLVSIEPISPARGRLVIYDIAKGIHFILSESVERGNIPVSWAPDSSILIYSIDSVLYFARPESFFTNTLIDASYRTLGPGSIQSVSWFASTRFLYISGATVYRIQGAELFARSLYTPLIGVGELAGKLPNAFNPLCDTFCASGDGSAILYAQNGRNVYYCPLEGDDYISTTRPALLPYLLLPGNASSLAFVWNADGNPAIFSESVEDGKRSYKAWKLTDISYGKVFTSMQIPSGIKNLSVSPDGKNCIFITAQGLQVYDTTSWKQNAVYRDETIVSAVWADESSVFIGGTETVRKWNIKTGSSSLLFISAAKSYGWDEKGVSIIADTESLGRFVYSGGLKWSGASALKLREGTNSANTSWRLYLDTGKGYYSNMLYIRSAGSPGGTKPLFEESPVKFDPLGGVSPSDKTGSASDVFSHGSRSGFRQVALVFDAMDTLDGLPKILSVLNRYAIHATFFINGEFIREHPAAVNEIIKAGHQCASLFFTTWDLSGTKYRIDEDFIIRGLARNEDDFYAATGQELTLLWHAPYYITSPMILEAGKKAGYRYVSGDVTVLDWVSSDQSRLMPGLYRTAAELVEDIIKSKKPGSIIPIRIGKPAGDRADYLFEKIDILINALSEAGYSIVSVDTLIQNNR